MSLHMYCIAIDCHDPASLAAFWGGALDRPVGTQEDGDTYLSLGGDGGAPFVCFYASRDVKATKNRLHFDLRPDDQEAEVARLVALGATQVDIGQCEPSWVVLADPEGNEFCVLRADTEPTPG